MGQLPNNPAAAAEEAAAAIIQAKADGMGGLCFVELFLPQYDIAQGPNMYDEVEAIEFCMILTNCLTTQSVIYVKDQTSLNKVNRSLAKKRTEMLRRDNSLKAELYQTEEVEIVIDKDDELVTDGDDENKESNGRKEAASSMTESNVQSDFYDDFAELSSQGDMFFDPKATPDEAEEKKQTKITKKIVKRKKSGGSGSESTAMSENHRLASLLGDAKVSEGDKMTQEVVQAVKANGLPRKDEETMIILSANSEAEMLAIRALVSKYMDKKNIILVNCRLDPLPLELESCSTAYHLTPFVATTVVDPNNLFNNNSQDEPRSIRAVSIRRYPGDWEVYVDTDGNGFELAQKIPASKVSNRGPTAEWIVGAIKSFLES